MHLLGWFGLLFLTCSPCFEICASPTRFFIGSFSTSSTSSESKDFFVSFRCIMSWTSHFSEWCNYGSFSWVYRSIAIFRRFVFVCWRFLKIVTILHLALISTTEWWAFRYWKSIFHQSVSYFLPTTFLNLLINFCKFGKSRIWIIKTEWL